MPFFHASVCPCVRSSCFYRNLNISFIFKDIISKFAGNVYGCENISVQNFILILKNKMAATAEWGYKDALKLEVFQIGFIKVAQRIYV